jgi:hypothetical protein
MGNDSKLAVIEGEYRDIMPVLSPDEAKAAMEAYQALATAITGPDDYQTFKDRDGKVHQFRKRSGWKKLERFFFVSLQIMKEQVIHAHNPKICLRVQMPEHFKDVIDCGCPVEGARCVVRALDTRSGRFSDNAGVCMRTEKRVSKDASLHDLQTRAFNRAANRATADLLGVSDPSAEERQAEGGYSKEERTALSDLFKEAPEKNRLEAMNYMEGITGLDESSDRDIYIAFLRRGTEDQYNRVMDILRASGELAFDPDDVPVT